MFVGLSRQLDRRGRGFYNSAFYRLWAVAETGALATVAARDCEAMKVARKLGQTAMPASGESTVCEDWVLTESEAIELLALLISSARIQMDEPAHYGPLRLLTATERLSAAMLERSSEKSGAFLQEAIDRIPEMRMMMSDVGAYTAELDLLCRGVAECLLRHSALEDGSS